MSDQELLQHAMWMLGMSTAHNERAIQVNQRLVESNERLLALVESMRQEREFLMEVIEAYRVYMVSEDAGRAANSVLAKHEN